MQKNLENFNQVKYLLINDKYAFLKPYKLKALKLYFYGNAKIFEPICKHISRKLFVVQNATHVSE